MSTCLISYWIRSTFFLDEIIIFNWGSLGMPHVDHSDWTKEIRWDLSMWILILDVIKQYMSKLSFVQENGARIKILAMILRLEERNCYLCLDRN